MTAPWRRSDVSATCAVCGNLIGSHSVWFKQPRDPHDALHDRIDFRKKAKCPDGEWITWAQVVEVETE